MLFPLDAYELQLPDPMLSASTRQAIVVLAVKRAFLFYSDYYRSGNVDDHYTSFFGNWQVQCFSRLYKILHHMEKNKADSGAKQAASKTGPWLPNEAGQLCIGAL